MERSNPDEIVEGPRLDELRARHPEFISKMLEFGCDQEATRAELAAAYADWRGMVRDGRGAPHYSSNDIHNLFALIRSIPGVAEDSIGKKFTGVGVDEGAASDLRRRQEDQENGGMSQQEITLEDLTQAAYRRLLALVESESPTEAFEAIQLIIRLVVVKQSALQQLADLETLLDGEEG